MNDNFILNASLIQFEEFGALSLNVISAYLFIIAFLGVSSNILLMVVFFSNKELRTPINWLFMNLTFGDLLVSVGGTCVAFVYTATRTVMGHYACNLYGFVTFLGGKCFSVPVL